MPPDDHDDNFKSSDNVVAFPSKDVLAEIERLAALDPIEYDRERSDAANRLECRKSTLDDRVAAKRAERAKPEPRIFSSTTLAESAQRIIVSEDVFGLFAEDWAQLVAGEEHNAKLLYLIATSRLFPKAMHAAIKGPSSGGKSEIRKQVLEFFPREAVISFTSLSERALLYFEDDFEHRILSMGEASGADEQSFQDYLLRELMSEGVLRYRTVQKVGNEMVTVSIEKNGPVAFLVTTTRLKLHAENETRMLSLEVDDSESQTRAVLNKVAAIEGVGDRGARVDFGPWQDFQRWLEMGDRQVVIPYAKPLAAAVPPKAVRLRRDFTQVLCAIKAHALIHREHRSRNDHGYIIADVDHDYAAVRELMHDLLRHTAEVATKQSVIEAVEAVKKLTKDMDDNDGATAKVVGKELRLDKSTAYRRLSAALFDGLVINLEEKKGRPGRYRATDEIREDEMMLPTAEGLKLLCSPTPPKSLQPCNQGTLGEANQQDSGCTGGCNHDDNQHPDATGCTVVADRLQPGLQPLNDCKDEENGQWLRGCTKSEGVAGEEKNVEDEGSAPEADPDDPSSYLNESNVSAEPDPFDIPIPAAFRRSPSPGGSST